jgi:MoxR-like ATPase
LDITTEVLNLDRNALKADLPSIAEVGSFILVGPPGTGKSWLVRWLAEKLECGFYKVSSNPDALASDVLGAMLPKEDGTGLWGFVPGPYAHAAGHGPRYGFATRAGVLCVDDLHEAGNGMMAALYVAADGRFTEWLDPRGEMLPPDRAYRYGMTSNGDVDSLAPAVRDRIAAVIPVKQPSDEMLDALHHDVRELCEADYDNNYNPIATYRQWRSVSDFWPKLGLAKACLLALGTPERASKMLHALADFEVPDAIKAVKELAGVK